VNYYWELLILSKVGIRGSKQSLDVRVEDGEIVNSLGGISVRKWKNTMKTKKNSTAIVILFLTSSYAKSMTYMYTWTPKFELCQAEILLFTNAKKISILKQVKIWNPLLHYITTYDYSFIVTSNWKTLPISNSKSTFLFTSNQVIIQHASTQIC